MQEETQDISITQWCRSGDKYTRVSIYSLNFWSMYLIKLLACMKMYMKYQLYLNTVNICKWLDSNCVCSMAT